MDAHVVNVMSTRTDKKVGNENMTPSARRKKKTDRCGLIKFYVKRRVLTKPRKSSRIVWTTCTTNTSQEVDAHTVSLTNTTYRSTAQKWRNESLRRRSSVLFPKSL